MWLPRAGEGGREEGIPLCPTLQNFGEEKQRLLLLWFLFAEPRVPCQLLPGLSLSSHPHSCHLSLCHLSLAELLGDSSSAVGNWDIHPLASSIPARSDPGSSGVSTPLLQLIKGTTKSLCTPQVEAAASCVFAML